ncbi:MAG: hypothetical protein IGQ45_04590 [Cyanobacterium sp. T60_A2020_053]|nr:hypothetical protein [Cyanobacterium sp. T60_A2020_053]
MTDKINKIEHLIQNAITDGRITPAESEIIRHAVYFDPPVTTEKIHLWCELQIKITNAEILLDHG